MNFTARTLADTARKAGVNVFFHDGYGYEHSRLRISHGETHILVQLSWNGREEQLYSAKLVSTDGGWDASRTFDHVDTFSSARHFALLGWVFSQIQDLIDAKGREDEREASWNRKLYQVKAQRRAQQRRNRAFRRDWERSVIQAAS